VADVTPASTDAEVVAAKAWARFYLWAQDQPGNGHRTRRAYKGESADDILAANGITLAMGAREYCRIADRVIAMGYEIAGGKQDNRGIGESLTNLHAVRARSMRDSGATLREIGSHLHISIASVHRLLRVEQAA
jgi:hypothetical protein